MNRFFKYIGSKTIMTVVMLFLVFSPFNPLIAQAQTAQGPTQSGDTVDAAPQGPTRTGATLDTVSPSASNSNSNGTFQGPTQSGATLDTTQGGGVANNDIGCDLRTAISNFGGTFALCLTNVVYIFTVGIGSGFAYVAAYFFDLAVQISLNGASYALTFISTSWTTARDLANMAFLFILIFIAFQIMLKADTAGTQSLLAGVIVIALLVNFSFFFTRLVIDAGNILSIEFYNSIQAPPLSATTAAAGVSASVASGVQTAVNVAGGVTNGNTKDLTANIMGMLQLQNLFNTNSFKAFFSPKDGSAKAGFMVTAIALTFLYIAAGIMFWLLSVMFITAGIKFLTRVVVLWFLIIFSPLAFVAWILPDFKKYFNQWRDLLISHSFYPAAFMFIFLILTNFASQLSCTVNGAPVANCTGLINDVFSSLSAATNSSSAVAAIGYAVANVGIRLGFVIAILYLGMQASQKVSVMGASGAENASRWILGRTFGASAGFLGFGGRQLAGRGFSALAKSPTMAAGAQQKGFSGTLWRGASNVTKRMAGATYDARNAPGSSLLKKSAETFAGGKVDTGKAAAKGYAEQAKEASEKSKKEKTERAAIIRDEANKKAIEEIEEDNKTGAAHNPANIDRVKNMNKREIESLKSGQLANIAHLLKESQDKTVQDSDKYTDEEKDKVRKISEPIRKSQKLVVDELRKLNNNLITTGSPIVQTHSARGQTINLAAANAMDANLQTIKTTLQANLNNPATTQGQAEDIKSDMNHIRQAIKNVRELTRALPNVPAHAGRPAGTIIAD